LFGGIFFPVVTAFALIPGAALSAQPARPSNTRFVSCEKNGSPNFKADSTPGSTSKVNSPYTKDPHCSVPSGTSPSSLNALLETAPLISGQLVKLTTEMQRSQKFDNSLEQSVLSRLDESIERYERLSRCQAPCQIPPETLDSTLKQHKALKTELALMQPDDISINARQSPKAWTASRPIHPFPKAASLPLAAADEKDGHRREFLRRLADKTPFIKSRTESLLKNKGAIAENPAETQQIDQAMIEIRNEARQKYLELISGNPLLLFAKDGSEIRDASKKLADEIRSEKKRLLELPKEKRLDALIEYTSLTENILKSNPEFCETAEKLAAAAESRRIRKQVGLVAGQIGMGLASAFMCGTMISCSLAAAGVASLDFGIASHDASMAFQHGVSQAATDDASPKPARPSESIMTRADAAASVRGLSLVLGAPTVIKSSLELVRRGSALAASGHATRRAQLNTLDHIVYRDLLSHHVGREREIVETVIERLQQRKLTPDQISKFIQERVRQCSK